MLDNLAVEMYEYYGLDTDVAYWFCIQSPDNKELDYGSEDLLMAIGMLEDEKDYDILAVCEESEYGANVILEIPRSDLLND